MSAVLPSMPTPPLAPQTRLPWWQRVLSPLVSPPVFDFWVRRLHPTWAWSRTLARIVERRVEARDAVTLVLQPNRHFRGFRPGQHLSVTVEVDGVRLTRSYSPTGIPRRDRRISLTVKRIVGGRVSTHLVERARVGDVVELGPAYGALCLPEASSPEAPVLLLAAGSGITPLMSLVRALAARDMPVPVTLLYWARTRDELCFTRELRELAARFPALCVRFLLTRQAPLTEDEGAGRIDADTLARWVPDLDAQQVYACGPSEFVAQAHALTAETARSVQVEAFTPPAVDGDVTGSVRVTLSASGRVLELPRNQSLLVSLEAQGLQPAHGCRMGICNTCACGKRSGTTQNLLTHDLQDEAEQALRICVSAPRSDLVLDL